MARQLIIGDIHGYYDELQALLDRAGLAQGDAIIARGELIDRGPAPQRVLSFFQTQANARAILGNHERKHLRWSQGRVEPSAAQVITRLQFGAAYPDIIPYLATLPPYMELPEVLLVHGFFEPGVALEAQRENVLIGTMTGEHYLRHRYLRPWYELVRNRSSSDTWIIIVTASRLCTAIGVFGIDTSCCLGGRLTGLLLPDVRFVSVASRSNHWRETREHYPQALVPFELVWAEAALAASQRIYDYVLVRNSQVLAALRATPAYDGLPPGEQARLYITWTSPVFPSGAPGYAISGRPAPWSKTTRPRTDPEHVVSSMLEAPLASCDVSQSQNCRLQGESDLWYRDRRPVNPVAPVPQSLSRAIAACDLVAPV